MASPQRSCCLQSSLEEAGTLVLVDSVRVLLPALLNFQTSTRNDEGRPQPQTVSMAATSRAAPETSLVGKM